LASYNYTALDKQGKKSKGTLEANSMEAASNRLRSDGMTVIKISEASFLNKDIEIKAFQKKPKPRDLAIFCRQIVSILKAGVPMDECLAIMAEQTENAMLRDAAINCRHDLESGLSLSEAMSQYAVFPDVFVTMVNAGEQSGNLETAFSRMAERFEKDAKLKGMVKKATIYPIVVGVVAVIVIIFMMAFVVPKFEDILSSLGSELPGLTKAVVAISHFVAGNIFYIILAVILLVILFRYFKTTDAGKHLLGKIKLKLPLFGKLTVRTACSNYARTVATLLASGVPMMEALAYTATVMENVWFKEALQDVRTEVSIGVSLSEALKNTKMFPALVYHMTHIGEETADIEGMYDRLADYYDEEVQMSTESVMAAIEPLIIVVLAAIVGTIVVSLILPMASMYGSMNNL